MRLIINKIVLLLSTFSAIIGLGFLFWILITLTIKGVGAIDLHIFTHDLVNNGLRNLFVGQFILALIAVIIGVPIGMIAGIYLQEYSFGNKYAEFIRNLSDVMMSAPSIVIGTFVYAVVVNPVGHQNGWAGAIALAIIMIPVVVELLTIC
jgi:phosphate transport system permease protein